MTTPELEPMSPELRALLDGERAPGAAPGKERVRARVDATLFGSPPGGGSGSGSGSGSGTTAAARLARAAAIFVAGGVVGGAIVLAVRPARVEIVERRVEVPVELATAPVTSRPALPVAPPTAEASASASATPVVAPSSLVPAGDTFAAERALLDPARTALGRGDGASALDAANRHAARYGNGKLSEEREAIAVQALVLLHRSDEARARGARFHVRYPGSVLGPAVDAALGTLP